MGPCDGMQGTILPGGYTSLVVNPGPSCFQAEMEWELTSVDASASETLGKVKLNLQPGRAVFVRLERGKGFLTTFVLRPINPEVAKPEIGRCRQTIPLSSEEMFRALEEEAHPKPAAFGSHG